MLSYQSSITKTYQYLRKVIPLLSVLSCVAPYHYLNGATVDWSWWYRQQDLSAQIQDQHVGTTDFSIDSLDLMWSRNHASSNYLKAKQLIFNGQEYPVKVNVAYPIVQAPDKSLEVNFGAQKLKLGIAAPANLALLYFKQLSLLITDETNRLQLTEFGIHSGPDQKIGRTIGKNITTNCEPVSSSQQFLEAILANCFRKGVITAASVSFANGLAFEGAQLKVDNNNFTLNLKLLTPISGKTKITGTTNYRADQRLLTVEVKSAKLGIINIRNRIFKELAKANSASIKVNEPFIMIKL